MLSRFAICFAVAVALLAARVAAADPTSPSRAVTDDRDSAAANKDAASGAAASAGNGATASGAGASGGRDPGIAASGGGTSGGIAASGGGATGRSATDGRDSAGAVSRSGEGSGDGKLLSDDTWRYASTGTLAVDGGVVVGFPAALPTGLSTGLGAGFTYGGTFALGARASWSTATESSETWKVTHDDIRLRATAALRHSAGRGTFGLRIGVGGTLVHEVRLRNQGMRAGLSGDELETRAFALLPAADVEAVVALHVMGPWLFAASGGPTVTLDNGMHAGWTTLVGVAWQP